MSDDDGSGSGSESDEPIKWFPPEEFHIPHVTQEEEVLKTQYMKLTLYYSQLQHLYESKLLYVASNAHY